MKRRLLPLALSITLACALVLVSGCGKHEAGDDEAAIAALGDEVMYYVLVDRFMDGDGGNNAAPVADVEAAANFKGGDWAGLLAAIDSGYFEDLGVTALCISSPVKGSLAKGLNADGHERSGYGAHWPSDPGLADPRFGDAAALTGLVAAAHARGMKVFVDYVLRDLHIGSPVFAAHPDWFWPNDNGGGGDAILGSGIPWDSALNYRGWLSDYLPPLNFSNSAAKAYAFAKAVALINDYDLDGLFIGSPSLLEEETITDLRSAVDAAASARGHRVYVVGDSYAGTAAALGRCVGPTTGMDGQLDYLLREAVIDSLFMADPMTDLGTFLSGNQDRYAGIMASFLGGLNTPRPVHFGEDTPLWSGPWDSGSSKAWSGQPALPGTLSAFERLGCAYAVSFCLPGLPFLQYGDEIGMAGAGEPDNARMMAFSGLSAGQTLLKSRIARLAAIRAAHPALRHGSYATLSSGGGHLAFSMTLGSDLVLVLINKFDSPATIAGMPASSFVDALTDETVTGPDITVPARSVRILTSP